VSAAPAAASHALDHEDVLAKEARKLSDENGELRNATRDLRDELTAAAARQRELQGLIATDAALQLELSSAKTLLTADQLKQVSMLLTPKQHQTISAKMNPRDIYLQLIELATDAYKAAIAAPPSSSSSAAEFEFQEANSWVPIADPEAIQQLRDLTAGKAPSVVYSIGAHSYSATLDMNSQGIIAQMNVQLNTKRSIRIADATDAPTDILFGPKSVVHLSNELLESATEHILHTALGPHTNEMCLPLAELAELFSSLGSKFKYVADKDAEPTTPDAKRFTTHRDADTEQQFNSVGWWKPARLAEWLVIAKGRGYHRCRVVVHGSRGYEGLGEDAAGHDGQYDGRNGEVYGKGVYCGLSDHATINYNMGSGFPNGSCVIGLLLTHEGRNDWNTAKPKASNVYRTCTMRAAGSRPRHDSVLVTDWPLLLPLGFAHAFDPRLGWVK
jgi:hypothetical protein